MDKLAHRLLNAEDPEDVRILQVLHEAAPGYSRIVHGRDPGGREALETFHALPPGKTLADKFVLGFFLGPELVGCAELIRGYPQPEHAYVGLMLFSEAHQNKGLGPKAMAQIALVAARWGCPWIRLAVIATNTRAHAFWLRQGFTEVFRKTIPGVTGEAIVMQRST
jgi:GNAT superfamily N-acetyltransferase